MSYSTTCWGCGGVRGRNSKSWGLGGGQWGRRMGGVEDSIPVAWLYRKSADPRDLGPASPSFLLSHPHPSSAPSQVPLPLHLLQGPSALTPFTRSLQSQSSTPLVSPPDSGLLVPISVFSTAHHHPSRSSRPSQFLHRQQFVDSEVRMFSQT